MKSSVVAFQHGASFGAAAKGSGRWPGRAVCRRLKPARARTSRAINSGAVFLVLATVAAWAQTPAPAAVPIRPLPEFRLPPRIGLMGDARLTLQDVLERVLENDPDLRVTRISRQQAGYQVRAAEGAYDPVMGLQAYHTKAVSPVASLLGGSQSGRLTQNEINVTPTFTGLTPWGGSYTFNFSNSRQQSDSLFLTLNPQYPTSATLKLTQPLLRGLRFDPNRYRLEVADRKSTRLN